MPLAFSRDYPFCTGATRGAWLEAIRYWAPSMRLRFHYKGGVLIPTLIPESKREHRVVNFLPRDVIS